MAQLDGMRRKYADDSQNAPPSATRYGGDAPIPKTSALSRFASFTPRAPTMAIATVEQLIREGGEQVYARWPSMSKGTSTPTIAASSCNSPVIIGRNFDPEENNSSQLMASPSVLARVKEKAWRWRRTLSVQRASTLDPNITPSWGVSLDDIDGPFSDDDIDYLGPSMHDSELAPDANKEATLILVSENSEEPNPNQTEAVTVKLAPNLATLAPTSADSEQQPSSDADDQVWDNSVSVKEYIMHKLEPGEEEKALSEMIVQAMSPRSTSTTTVADVATGSNVVVDAVAAVATATGTNVAGAAAAVASVATTTGSNVVGAVTTTGSNVVGAAAAVATTTGSNVAGVVGKMRGAVTSLLRADQVVSSLTSATQTPTPDSSQAAEKDSPGRKLTTN